MMNIDNLLYENVVIIKYETAHGTGMMIVKVAWYNKQIKKFQRLFKDCNIYYMSECVLTPEVIKELNI